MGFVARPAFLLLGAAVIVTMTSAAASCGFDGAGSGEAEGPGEAGPARPGPDSAPPIGSLPDASVRQTCAWPTLQVGAPWPMLGGCVTHAGRTVFRGPHVQPRKVWQADVKTYHPVPSIGADGTIYVPADTDGVVAFSPDGGGRRLDFSGRDVTNAPAIGSDGTLYAGAQNFASARRPDGGLSMVDLREQVDTSAVLDADGNVYMGSFADKLVSLDPAGKLRWEFPTGGDIVSSAAIGPNGDIYVGSSSNRLFALGKDGVKRWEYDAGSEIKSSPVVADDGTIYVGTTGKKLHAVAPDGTRKWVHDTDGPFEWQMLPALGWDGTIYAPSGSKLEALRPDGTVRWTFDAKVTLRTAAVVDVEGLVYVGGDSNLLFAITPEGNELWRFDVKDPPAGFAIGRDGTMYVTCDNSDGHSFGRGA